jgi:hypothetical protein
MSRNFSSVPSKLLLEEGSLAIPKREQGFRYIQSPEGTLIIPSDHKRNWTMEERAFRSILFSPEGKVLSAGFPKFANLKENGFTDHYHDLQNAFKHSLPIHVREKIDGSLIIRSVIGGKVHLRTRGSWALGRFQSAVLPLANSYLHLMDPTLFPHHSLLFEFCSSSPKLRVVLAHQTDSLTFLGAVDNRNLELLPPSKLDSVARKLGVSPTPTISLSGSLSNWKKQVATWNGREGVVIVLDTGTMIKLKSDSYLTLHRLTTSFSIRATKRLILTQNLRSKEQFTSFLSQAGADWECIKELEPLIDATSSAYHYARERYPQLTEHVDSLCIQNPGNRNKQVHKVNQLEDEADRQAALLYRNALENGRVYSYRCKE